MNPPQSDNALRAIVVHQAAMILDRDLALGNAQQQIQQFAQSIKTLQDAVRRLQDKLGMTPGDADYLEVGDAVAQ